MPIVAPEKYAVLRLNYLGWSLLFWVDRAQIQEEQQPEQKG